MAGTLHVREQMVPPLHREGFDSSNLTMVFVLVVSMMEMMTYELCKIAPPRGSCMAMVRLSFWFRFPSG